MNKENRKLITNSSCEWNKFILEDFYQFDVKSTSNIFSGEIYTVKYEDDFRFASIISSSQEVQSKIYGDYFYLLSTSNAINWSNGEANGYLNNGGIVIFDCTKEIKFEFLDYRVSNSFLIPFHFFNSSDDIDIIRHGKGILYQEMIYQLLEDTNVSSYNLINRMHTIANLLTINEPLKIVDDNILYKFTAIKEFIYTNAEDPNLSLDYIASNLLMSRSKIQSILREYGTNYTTLVKKIRVNKLAKSIKCNITKNLYQLCFEHGYKSISSASAQFKSEKGMSLKEYRDKMRG